MSSSRELDSCGCKFTNQSATQEFRRLDCCRVPGEFEPFFRGPTPHTGSVPGGVFLTGTLKVLNLRCPVSDLSIRKHVPFNY